MLEHEYVGHSLEEAGAGIEVGEAIRFHVAKVVHFLYKANNIWLKMIRTFGLNLDPQPHRRKIRDGECSPA